MCTVKLLLLALKVIKDKGIIFEEEKTVPVPVLEDANGFTHDMYYLLMEYSFIIY